MYIYIYIYMHTHMMLGRLAGRHIGVFRSIQGHRDVQGSSSFGVKQNYYEAHVLPIKFSRTSF